MFDIIDNGTEKIYVLKYNSPGADINLFEESANEFIKSDIRDMTIDLKGQDVMNSMLLASLIRIRSGLSADNRVLFIKNCNPHIYKCFELAGLENFFSF